MAVSNKPNKDIDHKINRRTMTSQKLEVEKYGDYDKL